MTRSRLGELLDTEVSWPLRVVVVVASVLLVAALFQPLWDITLYSNQYPDGLDVLVGAGGFQAGGGGADLTEINTLNHYIGMKALDPADIPELKWIGVALVAFVLLAFRAAVFGRIGNIVDLLVLFMCFGGASFWMFYARMHQYGHSLDPRAAVKVQPFTPPLFGTQQLANFTVESYPAMATYLLGAFGAVLAVAILLAWRATLKARKIAS
jgi:copper chaperone NosL